MPKGKAAVKKNIVIESWNTSKLNVCQSVNKKGISDH